MSTPAECVAAGAAFLDEHDPGWWRPDVKRAIDLDTLDLGYGDRCVLGQRCPLETLVAYLGWTPDPDDPEDDDELAYRYAAYAALLSGIPYGEHDALALWAAAHGFNTPHGADDGGGGYAALTAEWRKVIEARRSA